MDEKLYRLMNWPEIEAIVYSEHDKPHQVLGPKVTSEGVLVATFNPTASKISVLIEHTKEEKKTEYPMEKVDASGFFSVLLPSKHIPKYEFQVTYDNGIVIKEEDPYRFLGILDEQDMMKFNEGLHDKIYDKLGAHMTTMDGVEGVSFAVWAPNAIRVSVVGDFNMWDGRRHPMERRTLAGVFELFIPRIPKGSIYKYEIKIKGGMVVLKSDPYANFAEVRPANASKIWNIDCYQWNDDAWLAKRKETEYERAPMNIYEVQIGSFKRPKEEGKEFYTYKELAPILTEYVCEMGYTHIELLPIMEYPYDGSWGYQVTGYYAPTSRYGTPDDFMYLVDYLHQHEIGVILDWVPAHFPTDAHGLANFDGTCLYEHRDPKQGMHPHWGTLIYNYGRPQVANFLIANALFWIEKYHMDGIRMDAVASMLYLDYGKEEGEWIPNMYGGNENLEAIEMLSKLNRKIKERNDGSFVIAEESTAWPKVSHKVEDGGLGFDFKWNMGWMNDFIDYMTCDPLFRKGRQGELTFSMVYAYSERFILILSHDEVVHEKCSMLEKMPGTDDLKFANLRVAYGFMYAHPGKKLLFMGQEFAQRREWDENTQLQWELLEVEAHTQMQTYVKELNHLYLSHKALYEYDYDSVGFEWIDTMDSDRSILIFLRKTKKEEETLLVVCNFTPVVYQNYKIGVPFQGKYKEIFNSDAVCFGGSGATNPRVKQSKEVEVHERSHSINIKVPPLGISIYSCTPMVGKNSKVKKGRRVCSKATLNSKNKKKEVSNTTIESHEKIGAKNQKKASGIKKGKTNTKK